MKTIEAGIGNRLCNEQSDVYYKLGMIRASCSSRNCSLPQSGLSSRQPRSTEGTVLLMAGTSPILELACSYSHEMGLGFMFGEALEVQ